MPTVREMVEEYLREYGFGGLCGEDCGCQLSDLAPCGDGPFPDCEAGYKYPCDPEKCELECDGKMGYVPNSFCLRTEKPAAQAEKGE
jgi:hypothetical protein